MTPGNDQGWQKEIQVMIVPLLSFDSFGNVSHSELAKQFNEDNFYFKKVLRVLLLFHLGKILKRRVCFDDLLEKELSKRDRKSIFDSFRKKTGLTLPSLEIGSLKFFIAGATVVFALLLSLILIIIEPIFIGTIVSGFLVVIFIPLGVLRIIFPSLFEAREIEGSTTVGDFVDSLVLLNWGAYRENNYERTLTEIQLILLGDVGS